MKKIIIYVLIDPRDLKVKYIGKTIRSLNDRLCVHIANSRKRNSKKDMWLKELSKLNSKPFIKKIVELYDTENASLLESFLIAKYEKRILNTHDILGKKRIVNNNTKAKISATLKKGYLNKIINLPAGKKVYVYLKNGSFYKEFNSISETAKELNQFVSTIKKHVNFHLINPNISTKDGRKRHLKTPYQYSSTKVDNMYNYEI
jgi:hypothetical protein